MEVFYSIDLAIFYLLNHSISTGFLDKFFSIITNVNNWYISYLILLSILFFKGGRIGKIAVLGIIILITVTDQIGYRLLKEFFERARPCNALSDVLAPLGCTGSYSFPSNHAINNFAAAAFFSMLFPKYKIVLFVTAFLVAISRVYLGLHYPSDIIAGAAIGMIFGYIFARAVLKINDHFNIKQNLNTSNSEQY
jgi:undecaprenyl-diphosphatase